MRLLAIDPSSNLIGIAIFDFGKLVHLETIGTKFTERRFRQQDLVAQVSAIAKETSIEHVAIENPFLQGQGNSVMQRVIGALEVAINAPFTYFAPTSVKKAMGSGKLSKLEMALNAGAMLHTEEEQDLLAEAINNEAWDSTDACCIGLAFLRGGSKSS